VLNVRFKNALVMVSVVPLCFVTAHAVHREQRIVTMEHRVAQKHAVAKQIHIKVTIA